MTGSVGNFPTTAKGMCELSRHAVETFRKSQHEFPVTVESWLLDYGREYEYRPRPDWLPRMTPRLCFFNSMALMMSEEGAEHGLSYCEGYVCGSNLPINIHHAWTIRPDGIVVDPTLPEEEWDEDEISYFGIAITDLELLKDYFAVPDRGCLIEHPAGRELVETHHSKGTLNAR